jgi:PAS domain S-box-containing protein
VKRKGDPLRAWLAVGLAAALALLGAFSCARMLGAAQPVLGVEWIQSTHGPVAIDVEQGSPAWESGLRPGDVLEEVDGREVDSALDAIGLPWDLGTDEPGRVTVRRGGESVGLDVVAGHGRGEDTYGYLCLVGFAFLLTGLFIVVRWPLVRGGSVYAGLAAVFYIHLVFTHTGSATAADWFFYWVDMMAAIVLPAALIHFAAKVSRRPSYRSPVWAAYGISGVLLLATAWFHPSLFGGVYRFGEPERVVALFERLETLFLGLAVVAAAGIVFKSYGRARSVPHRSQLRWILWGSVLGLMPFALLYAIPWGVGASELPRWANFLSVVPMLVAPAAFTTALTRYRLHDLDVIVRRAVAEVAAVFLTFAVYAASVYTVHEILSGILDLSRSAARYIGIFLAVVTYPQSRVWMRTAVDRAFYRKRYSYRTTLLDWARELSAELDLGEILARVRERVKETLGVREAQVFLREGPARFEVPATGDGTAVIDLDETLSSRLESSAYVTVDSARLPGLPWVRYLFGLKVKGDLKALLGVAERGSPEEPLSSEDRALLITLSAHAATAIEAARLLEEVKRSSEEIRRAHAREQTVLESSAVGLLMLDETGRILAWNRALEGIYGLGREEAIGRTLVDLFPLHFVRHLEAHMRRSPDDGEARVFRYTLVNREGRRIVLNLAISTAVSGRDGAGARVVTFDDVTERVQLEEQVLRQERLVSLGLLAAGVAHEMNTPLTGISSYAQLLLEDLGPGDPRRQVMEKIVSQTGRASNIANSLLNLARPEQTAFETLSVNTLVEESLDLFAPQVRGRQTEIDVNLDGSLPEVRGHKGKLQQVLLNLLLNARDALSDDCGVISVRTYKNGQQVVLEVADNGTGIPAEDLPRIFDPFFTTKGRGRGTGLGLSISYGIVHEHEGEMHVQSEPGVYTRFRVEIPVAGAAEAMA